MALTPEIRSVQAGAFAVESLGATPEIRVPQALGLTVYNIPAEEIRTTYSGFDVVYRRFAPTMNITQALSLVVCRGTIDSPKLRAWYYTLDGHDFYVLKLGTTDKTLVFDLSTAQWSWWASANSLRWRANVGFNWKSAGTIPAGYGSNVIVGDDTLGVLWVLDPEKPLDDNPTNGGESAFERIATGQVPVRGRAFVPVYDVDLSASAGEPSEAQPTVTLTYSDDSGQTYVAADAPITVSSGDFTQEFSWRSVGLMSAPGRLFRIKDYGAFARLDSLEINGE